MVGENPAPSKAWDQEEIQLGWAASLVATLDSLTLV